MGNASISEWLKKEIEDFLQENPKYKAKYQGLKGFIDNACIELLDKIKKEQKK